MAITNREFKVGDKIVGEYEGTRYVAEAVPGTETKPILWRIILPKKFKSPVANTGPLWGGTDGKTFTIGHAQAVMTYPKVGQNRYLFFTRIEDEAAMLAEKTTRGETRAKTKVEKQADKEADKATKKAEREAAREAKKTEKATKVASRNAKSGGYKLIKRLEDGRWFCNGGAHVVTVDGEEFIGDIQPKDCQDGHVAALAGEAPDEPETEASAKPKRARKAKVTEPEPIDEVDSDPGDGSDEPDESLDESDSDDEEVVYGEVGGEEEDGTD